MAWEDDALGDYEKKKKRKEDMSKLSSQRLSLVEGNASRMRNELRQAITDKCKELNQKSGRELLKSVDPHTATLEIRREDGAKLMAAFDSASKVATFSSDSFLFGTRKYEVTSRPVDGNERAVWFEPAKKDIETQDSLCHREEFLGFWRRGTMKTPPDDPQFARFTEAMREIMKVSKVEMQRRIEAAKRKPKFRVSRVSGVRSKRAD